MNLRTPFVIAAALSVSVVGVPAQAAQTTVASTSQTLLMAPAMTLGFAFKEFGAPRPKPSYLRECGESERVLINSAQVKPRVAPGCRLIGGVWNVSGATVRSPGAIEVTPLVSEKGAWAQGAYGWTNATQRAFIRWYQNPSRECAVTAASKTRGCGYTLQRKGSFTKTAATTDLMLQPSTRLRCPEAAGIVGILASWGLSIDPAVLSRIEQADCGSTPVSVRNLNRVNPVTTRTVANPYLAPSSVGKSFRTDQVLDAPAGPVISAEQFGLHVPDVSGPEPTVPYRWLRLWDAKTGWEPLEQNRGTYYWQWLDDSVNFAEARGLKIMYVFGDTPAWAGPSASFPPTSINEFERYVNAVVSRYGNRISAYEVWNEPNLYAPMAKDVANLVDMTLRVRAAVDRWAPGAKVLTPSTTMRTDTAVYPFFKDYLLPLAAKGWPVDGFSVHTYPRAANGPLIRSAQVNQFQQMLALARAPKLPVWDTEVNYGLSGLQEKRREINQPDAAGYLSQTFLDSIRLGVTQTDWYLWFAQDYSLLGIQLTPATVDTNRAWQWTYDQIVGARLRACSTSTTSVVCGFERAGKPFVLAWSPIVATTRVRVPASLRQACDITNVCQPISNGEVTVGIRPIVLN